MSRRKLGRGHGWDSAWTRYHHAYLTSLSSDFDSVKLENLLINFNESFRNICNWLNVEFDSNAKRYWEYTHHIVYGSATARLKLHPEGSIGHETIKSESFRSDLNKGKTRFESPVFTTTNPSVRMEKEITKIHNILKTDGVKKLKYHTIHGYRDIFLYYIKMYFE